MLSQDMQMDMVLAQITDQLSNSKISSTRITLLRLWKLPSTTTLLL